MASSPMLKLFVLTCLILQEVHALGSVQKITGNWFQSKQKLDNAPLHATIQDTLDMFRKLKPLPPCNQIASASLLNNCAALDSNAGGLLEEIKTVYATRLAICELIDADVAIPPACAAFRPSPALIQNPELRGFLTAGDLTEPTMHFPLYEDSTRQKADSCTQQLHAKPQSWTSFSNSKQNALSMCHAMRNPVEKDDIIETYIKMSNITFRATEVLKSATESYDEVKAGWALVKTEIVDFQSALQNSLDRITKVHNDQMELAAAGLYKQVVDLTESAAKVMYDFQIWRDAGLTAHTVQLERAQDMALVLAKRTTEAYDSYLAGFSQNVTALGREIDRTVAEVLLIQDGLVDIEQDFADFKADIAHITGFTKVFKSYGSLLVNAIFSFTLFVLVTPLAHFLLARFTHINRFAIIALSIALGAASGLIPMYYYIYHTYHAPTRMTDVLLGSAITSILFSTAALALSIIAPGVQSLDSELRIPNMSVLRPHGMHGYKEDPFYWNDMHRLDTDVEEGDMDPGYDSA